MHQHFSDPRDIIRSSINPSMLSGKLLPNIQPSVLEAHLRQSENASMASARPVRSRKLLNSLRKQKLDHTEIYRLKYMLIKCCLSYIQDVYIFHLKRLKGLEILKTLIRLSPPEEINSDIAIHMIWASASCIHHFMLKVTLNNSVMQWIRRREFKKSLLIFNKIVNFLTSKHYSAMFSALLTFIEEASLWDIEPFCIYTISRVLASTNEHLRIGSIINILFLSENASLYDYIQPKKILQVLDQVEERAQWSWINDELIEKILDMYYNSLTPEENYQFNYECLEKSLETMLRAMSRYLNQHQLMFMICWMLKIMVEEKISENNLLFFSNLLEDFASLYTRHSKTGALPDKIIPIILEYMGSSNKLYCLLGYRLLQTFLDRCHNKVEFDTPKLFMKNTRYKINLNFYNKTDKEIFQKHSTLFHETIIRSVVTHGRNKIFLENVYTSIALFLVEIPCLYTAATGIYLAISLQERALTSKNMTLDHVHRIHAMAASLMTLICYIHKADLFYDYVEGILAQRAKHAPFLIPPLKVHYKYAQHHILWNKPDLFFEDWEAKYGLWRCFKNTEQEIVVVEKK